MWDMRLKIWKDTTFRKQYKEASERKQEDRNYETKMTPTGNLTREEWLQLRRNGIGGSDASVIMGKILTEVFYSCGKKKQESC